MAHVLCITSGLTGILHASFELVRRLEAAGHRVTCLSPSPVRAEVEAQGLTFEPLPPFVRHPVPAYPPRGGRLRTLAGRLASRRSRLGAGVEALQMGEAVRTLGALDADLALVDMETHEGVLAAHTLGLPVVLLSQHLSVWPGTGQPPLSSQTLPGRGEAGSPRAIRREWGRLGARRRARRLRQRLGGHADRSDALLHYARRVGFPTREWGRSSFPPPFLYRTSPVLSMTLEEMEFPQRPRAGLRYVGPMVAAERRDVRVTAEVAERAEAAIRESRAAGRSLIYAPASSMDAGDAAFHRRLLAVAARRPDWHLVLGLGGHAEAEALGPLPPNASVLAWVPQLLLLGAADAAIVHGGIHTIHECLHFGVPMLVCSGGRYDQHGCAARVAYHGLGVRGDKDYDSEAVIERKLDRVLVDPAIREALGRFQGFAERHRQANTVAEAVGAALAGRSR